MALEYILCIPSQLIYILLLNLFPTKTINDQTITMIMFSIFGHEEEKEKQLCILNRCSIFLARILFEIEFYNEAFVEVINI